MNDPEGKYGGSESRNSVLEGGVMAKKVGPVVLEDYFQPWKLIEVYISKLNLKIA